MGQRQDQVRDEFNARYPNGGGYVPPSSQGGPIGSGGRSGGAGFGNFGPEYTRGDKDPRGAGLYGLPDAFDKWESAARYSFAPLQQFEQAFAPVTNYFQNELGKNYQKDLYNLSADVANQQFAETRRQADQGYARAGLGGGAGVSPLASMRLQQEAQARSGVLGLAAQQAVFQSEALHTQAAQGLQNALAQLFQARLAPAQLQSARRANVPSQVGPDLIGPGLNALAGLLSTTGGGGGA